MILTKKQTVALDYLEDTIHSEVVYGGGAGGGKSLLGCYWQLKRRIKYPGTRGLIGRSKLKTLKDTTLKTLLEVCKMQGLEADAHYTLNNQSNTITLFNGSEILLKDLFAYPSDPNFDGLGSLEITDAFVDECVEITEKAKNILKSRIRYKLDENGLVPKMLMTCNPSKGWVYQAFYKPNREGRLDESKLFIQSLVTDNPYISKYYIENLEGLDPISKARLLRGEWEYDDDPAALIDFDSIEDYFTNEHALEGRLYITADIARLGEDSTVIRIWNGFRVIHREEIAKATIDQNVLAIRELANRYGVPMSRTVVDEDGVGGGVKDILKCKGFVNNSRAVKVKGREENYQNLKAQCTFRMAKRICNKEVYEDCPDPSIRQRITEEMEQVKRKDVDKDGKLNVIAKEQIKKNLGRSPDDWDSIMMREYFELNKSRILAST